MVAAFPCRACLKNVNTNHHAIFCDLCGTWIHRKCNKLTQTDYKKLQAENDNTTFICLCCIADNLPFSHLTDRNFNIAVTKGINYMFDDYDNAFSSPDIEKLSKIPNAHAFLEVPLDDDDEDVMQPNLCNYFDIDEFLEANFDSNKNFSILHFNIHSIQRHIDEFRTLLLLLNFHFDFIAVSESKLHKDLDPTVNIDIEGYNKPLSCPSEASKGGVLLYSSNNLNIIPRNDLQIYSPKEIESAFVEVVNHNKKNDLIGVIYRHHNIDKADFTNNYITPLVNKLQSENNKNIYVTGDFNINLLNSNSDSDVSEFFELMTSNLLMPVISLPTRVTYNTATLTTY